MGNTEEQVKWIIRHKEELENARTSDHSKCQGNCKNGATCHNQSDNGGWGWWSNVLDFSGIDPESMNFWYDDLPTPSTSINKGIAEYLSTHAPKEWI
jgi:hypothetical protein